MRPKLELHRAKGKRTKPYELGVKGSVATTLKHSKGGKFRSPMYRRWPGNTYERPITLAEVIPGIEKSSAPHRISLPRRCRLSAATMARRLTVKKSTPLKNKKTARDPADQTRDGARRSGRENRHRISKGRAPEWPQRSRATQKAIPNPNAISRCRLQIRPLIQWLRILLCLIS